MSSVTFQHLSDTRRSSLLPPIPEEPPAKRSCLGRKISRTSAALSAVRDHVIATLTANSPNPCRIELEEGRFCLDHTGGKLSIHPGPGRIPSHYTLWMNLDNEQQVKCSQPMRPKTAELFKVPYLRFGRCDNYALLLSLDKQWVMFVGYTLKDKKQDTLGYVELPKPQDEKISSAVVYRFPATRNPFTKEEAEKALLSLIERLSNVARNIFFECAVFNPRHGLVLHFKSSGSSEQQPTNHHLCWINRGHPPFKSPATYYATSTRSLLMTKGDGLITVERDISVDETSTPTKYFINAEEATPLAIPPADPFGLEELTDAEELDQFLKSLSAPPL